ASSAADASADGTGGSDSAASSSADATSDRRTRARPRSSVYDDVPIDSDDEREQIERTIAESNTELHSRHVTAPPRPRSAGAAAAADAGAAAGAGAGLSLLASVASRSSSSSSAARVKSHFEMDGKEYVEQMKANHARWASSHAAAKVEREAKAEKKAKRKVCERYRASIHHPLTTITALHASHTSHEQC